MMTEWRRHREKRPAGEFLAALGDSGVPEVDPGRRPAAVSLGIAFLLLRALSGVLWLIDLVTNWDTVVSMDPNGKWGVLPFAVLHIGWTVLLLALVRSLWRGSDVTRLVVLSWTTVNIIIFAVGYFARGQQIVLSTSLLALPLDILVLLALSGRDARAWTRARTELRHRARGKRRATLS